MPFEGEKFEGPPIPPKEEKEEVEETKEKAEEEIEEKPELEEFSEEEIDEAIERIAVVGDLENLSSDIVAKINVENIDTILDLGAEKLAKERQNLNKETFKNLEEGMEELSNRSSAGHVLLCAVNGKEDFKAFRGTIEKFAEGKEIEEIDEKISYLKETANRQIEMEGIAEELSKIDLKRRIGDLKKDDSFFLRSIPQLESLTPNLEEILNYFKKEEIQSKLKEIQSKSGKDVGDLTGKLEENLNLIKSKKIESVKDKFYDFCLDVSKLRFLDFEGLNEEKMKKVIESFKEPLTVEEIERLKEKENIEKLENLPLLTRARMELILTYLGEKPISEIGVIFEDKETYEREVKNKFSPVSLTKKVLTDSGLKFRISEHIDQPFPLLELVVGKSKKCLEEFKKAALREDHKKMGKLFGYPETAIKAFLKEKQEKREGELTLDDKELLEILPKKEKDELLKEGVLKFLDFKLSKDNWRAELDVARKWQGKIQEKAPKLYQEIIKGE